MLDDKDEFISPNEEALEWLRRYREMRDREHRDGKDAVSVFCPGCGASNCQDLRYSEARGMFYHFREA